MVRTAIGIDIGGTHLRAARISTTGVVEAEAREASSSDPDAVITRLIALVDLVDAPGVAAIGIGVPGRVDTAANRVLSGGYVDLSGRDVAEAITARTGRKVVLDNDASMALTAEAAVGAGKGAGNLVLLTIGTGIGGGIMMDGKVLRGRATAGQLGHVVVDPEGPQCLCGGRGCVETLSSGTALGGHIAHYGFPTGTRAEHLIGRAQAGDATARAVLSDWARPLQRAVDTLVATLDPDRVILGGGLGREAAEALSLLPKGETWYECPVVAATLGDAAGVIGAGLAALRTRPRGNRIVMVNGVPASGKSTVAALISAMKRWPLLALDTIKNPFLAEIGTVDRPFNRVLGRASYRAIFDVMGSAPAGSTFVVDAWFGFQPKELLLELIKKGGVTEIVEIWCSASPEVIARRYRDRSGERLPGHPGAEYAEELAILAARAEPMSLGPVLRVDTSRPTETGTILGFIDLHLS
jgi:glucokinase